MSKIIQITASVDVTNAEQMQALSEFLNALSTTDDTTSTAAPDPVVKKEEPKPAVTKPAPTTGGEKITDEDLRKIVKKKSADPTLRPKVKEVLIKYNPDGAKSPNVSGINAEDYAAAKKELEAIK